jgi:hypothetical protein
MSWKNFVFTGLLLAGALLANGCCSKSCGRPTCCPSTVSSYPVAPVAPSCPNGQCGGGAAPTAVYSAPPGH